MSINKVTNNGSQKGTRPQKYLTWKTLVENGLVKPEKHLFFLQICKLNETINYLFRLEREEKKTTSSTVQKKNKKSSYVFVLDTENYKDIEDEEIRKTVRTSLHVTPSVASSVAAAQTVKKKESATANKRYIDNNNSSSGSSSNSSDNSSIDSDDSDSDSDSDSVNGDGKNSLVSTAPKFKSLCAAYFACLKTIGKDGRSYRLSVYKRTLVWEKGTPFANCKPLDFYRKQLTEKQQQQQQQQQQQPLPSFSSIESSPASKRSMPSGAPQSTHNKQEKEENVTNNKRQRRMAPKTSPTSSSLFLSAVNFLKREDRLEHFEQSLSASQQHVYYKTMRDIALQRIDDQEHIETSSILPFNDKNKHEEIKHHC